MATNDGKVRVSCDYFHKAIKVICQLMQVVQSIMCEASLLINSALKVLNLPTITWHRSRLIFSRAATTGYHILVNDARMVMSGCKISQY